jgi:restriction system protein
MATSRRKSYWADDLVLAPWWVSFGLGVLAFAVLPALLPPLIRGLSLPIAFLFLCISAISILRSWKNAWMLDRQTGLDSLRELSSKQFEDLLGEAYRRQGYGVEERLGGGADGGVDLVLRRDGHVTLIQCKRWKGRPVPVQTVRELYGVLHDRGASAAKLVATTNFTSDAIAFARDKPIELVDSKALLGLLSSVQTSEEMAVIPISGARGTEAPPTFACPVCSAVMVKRTAKRGANAGNDFWGCSNFPRTGCRGTREIE